MDKETLWILERLAAQEISAISAERMLRALELLRKQERSIDSSVSQVQVTSAEPSQDSREIAPVEEIEVVELRRIEESVPIENVVLNAVDIQQQTTKTEEVEAVVEEAIGTYEILEISEQIPRAQKRTMSEILVENGFISRAQLDAATKLQKSGRKPGEVAFDLQLAEALVGLGYVDENDILFCYALQLGADNRLLSQIASNPELTEMLPLKLAHRYSIIPVTMMGRSLIAAAEKPLSNADRSELEAKLGCAVIMRIVSDV